MAKGINIGISSETREFSRGIKSGVIGPLEDVADVYKDIEKASDKAAKNDDLERALKDQQKESKDLAKEYSKAADSIQKDAKAAGRAVGTEMKDGTDKATDGVKDIGREAESTAKETAASFDGSADSIVGAFQEVAANAFAGFGPAGAIAGLAAAAGIGLVTAAFTAQQEAADELKAQFAEMYKVAIEEGRSFLSEAQIIEASLDLMWNPDRVDEYKEAQEEAVLLGLNVNEVIRARSGDEEALNKVTETGKQLLKDIGKELEGNDTTAEGGAAKRYIELKQSVAGNQEIGTELDANKKRVEETNSLLRNSTERQRDTAAATRDTGAAVDGVAGKINALPNKSVAIDVDTTTAERKLNAFLNKQRTITYAVNGNSRAGQIPI